MLALPPSFLFVVSGCWAQCQALWCYVVGLKVKFRQQDLRKSQNRGRSCSLLGSRVQGKNWKTSSQMPRKWRACCDIWGTNLETRSQFPDHCQHQWSISETRELENPEKNKINGL